jgi:hypothetical protein
MMVQQSISGYQDISGTQIRASEYQIQNLIFWFADILFADVLIF